MKDAMVVGAPPLPTLAVAVVSLKPKEHGAYAIVMIPLFSALLSVGPSWVGVAIVVASLAGFFAHEPILVAMGHRGGRVQRGAPWARALALGLLGLAVAAGAFALWSADLPTRIALLACLALSTLCFAIAIVRLHRTLGGQLLGVAGLSLPCMPILLDGGLDRSNSLLVWLVWLLGFASTTLAVRAVIAIQKRQTTVASWIGLEFTTAATIGLVVNQVWLPLAAVPMIAGGWGLMFWPPPAKHLRRVGWTLVAATMLTALGIISAVVLGLPGPVA
ncbi:YwiC-like family protein [Crateriforma spongiae]|uniref:YwiC-like family protein n=1 Tax=Crateriforma spongiae TaxID=2724528 RepID=UPI0039B06F5E